MHEPCECCWQVDQSKGCHCILPEVACWCAERRFRCSRRRKRHLIVSCSDVYTAKHCCAVELSEQVINVAKAMRVLLGDGVELAVVHTESYLITLLDQDWVC